MSKDLGKLVKIFSILIPASYMAIQGTLFGVGYMAWKDRPEQAQAAVIAYEERVDPFTKITTLGLYLGAKINASKSPIGQKYEV